MMVFLVFRNLSGKILLIIKMKLLILILIFWFSYSQTEITVIKVGSQLRPFVIEDSILVNLELIYNKNNTNKLFFKMKYVNSFLELFNELKNSPKHTTMVMSSISITKERLEKYDFSSPYIETKECLLTYHMNIDTEWRKPGKRIGYVKNTIEEVRAKLLKNNYSIEIVPFASFAERNEGIKTSEIDYYIGESAHYWNDPHIKVVHTFEKRLGMGLGIMYLKGSELKNKLEKYIKYYSHSRGFFSTMQRTFGKSYGSYFEIDTTLTK